MIGKYRWLVLTLIFIATCINYLDRQIIGLLKPILEKEFSWSESEYARIVMGFTAAYAVGLLMAGNIIDRIGTKLGYTLSIILWSLAGMMHALAKSVNGFIAARIGLGLGEAGNFPAGVKVIAEWFPKQERGLATGIFNAGTSIGVVMAVFIVPLVLNRAGWKEVFWITGSLGFVWLILWIWWYEKPTKQKRITEAEYNYIIRGQEQATDTKTTSIPYRSLLSYPQTWAYIAGKFFIDPIFWFFLFWLPSYFSSSFNLDLKKPSWELMVIYLATSIGSMMGGHMSSLLVRRGWPTIKARKRILLVIAFAELSVILTQHAHNIWIAVVLLSLAVALHQAWATNVFTLASDMFPKESVASVVGIGGMAGAVGGIIFPWFVGDLLDHFKSLNNIQMGYNILFTICGCTYLITYGLIGWLTKNNAAVGLQNEI